MSHAAQQACRVTAATIVDTHPCCIQLPATLLPYIMHFRALILGNGGLPWGHRYGWANRRWQQRRLQQQHNSTVASSSSGASASTSKGSYFERVKGFSGPWNAGLTSGTLSACGDLLAQLMQGQMAQKQGKERPAFDPSRTLRMFGFGLLLYGPYQGLAGIGAASINGHVYVQHSLPQFYWYNLLEHLMPVKTTATFLAKVTANQLLLAPVTLSTVFSWNLALTGQSHLISHKLSNDLWPTMVNGWKFWVPAASLNFYAVPLQYQVLYMSACGVLWTAYLSYASVTHISTPQPAPALPAPAPAQDSKSKRR